MNFREKVKALLEDEDTEKITLTHDDLDPQGKKSQVIVVKDSKDHKIATKHGYKLKESFIDSITKKVKALLEAEDTGKDKGSFNIPSTDEGGVRDESSGESQRRKMGGEWRAEKQRERIARKQSRTGLSTKKAAMQALRKLALGPVKVKALASMVQAQPHHKSQSVTDNTHPFYQRVKALSRGKKNNSLLEKKSKSVKTFKILLGRVGEKSNIKEEVPPSPGRDDEGWDESPQKREEAARKAKARKERRERRKRLGLDKPKGNEDIEDREDVQRLKKGSEDWFTDMAKKLGLKKTP